MRELHDLARKFEKVQEFIDYVAWQDWMTEFLDEKGYPTKDGEMQVKLIDECLTEIWNEVHKEVCYD